MGHSDDEFEPPRRRSNADVWMICIVVAAVICLLSLYVLSCGAMNSDRCWP